MFKKYIKLLSDPRPQLFFFVCLAIVLQLLVWIFNPQSSVVILYKLGLPILAAVVGLVFDYAVFPFARPDSYLKEYWKENPDADRTGDADYPISAGNELPFCFACLRRALIIVGFVLGVSLGL